MAGFGGIGDIYDVGDGSGDGGDDCGGGSASAKKNVQKTLIPIAK